MKNFLYKFGDWIWLAFLPLAAGVYLYLRSVPPPYGYPLSELSDQYWGILVDIARVWKSGELNFWSRSIGGGFCLYSSGFYPLWLPTNVAALVLSLDQFYLFKLVEPHVIGIFCAFLLLRIGLKLDLAWSCFGALTYVGFIFTRYVGILHYPFFLWACALFPLIVYFYNHFFTRPFYWKASFLGALMAFVFLGGGGGQYAQLIIWSLILLTLDAFVFTKTKVIHWVIGCAAFVIFSFSLVGIQTLPMFLYTFFESNRTLGEYAVNNFPLFTKDYKGTTSLTDIMQNSFLFGGRQGVRAFWAIMIFALGKWIVDYKLFREWFRLHKPMLAVGLATALFFFLPPVSQWIVDILPFTRSLFKPLKMFTFGYCGFLIDLWLVLFIVIVFSLKGKALNARRQSRRELVLLVFFVIAEIYLFLPFWLDRSPQLGWLRMYIPNYSLLDTQISFADRFVTVLILSFVAFSGLAKSRWKNVALLPAFVFLGSQLLFSSYICGSKGQRPSERFYFETPEHSVYRSLKGHYYMPYVDEVGQAHNYETMTHNYDLLFGVHGINGFLNIPPRRFDNFARAYHRDVYWTHPNRAGYKYSFGATPAALTTHFPVEFTTIRAGMPLPWPSFRKVVNGLKYDVWVREQPPDRVKFADQLKVVNFRELIDSFDRPYEGVIYITPEDFKKYQPRLGKLSGYRQAQFSNFISVRSDRLSFQVQTAESSLVLLPEMFQHGWRLRIDGRGEKIFPANHIFIGFFVPEGQHHIELTYKPVLWEVGILLNILAIALFCWVISRKND